MAGSVFYNSWRISIADRGFKRVNDVGSKFSIDRFATDNNSRNNSKNIENNQSSINLNSSRKFNNTYNFIGKNSNRSLSYESTMGKFRQLMLNKYGFNGNLNLHKETEKAPKVKVKRVVDLKGEDFSRLYNSSTRGPLSSHVIESGVYKDKKYIVLDDVRYESTISKSERLKTQKFQWMR